MENNSIWDLFINQTEYGGWGKVVAPMELGKSKDEAIFVDKLSIWDLFIN